MGRTGMQILVLLFATFLGFLKTFYIWGEEPPSIGSSDLICVLTRQA